MTAFESQSPRPDRGSPADNGRITVAMRGDSTRSDAGGPVSPWLYIAGALVTLAALYAVNFNLEDSGFAVMSYLLAGGGYIASYFLRVRGISLRGLQVPLLTLLGFFFLLSLLFGQGSGAADSPSHNLQIALTWVAILHSYTLSNNGAVLFACVPAMTLIALVCTSTTELEAQNAFLVFFSAATFLLIHENYLRTQANAAAAVEPGKQPVLSMAPDKRPMLFGSQFALAIGCFLSAIILARATVVPMQMLGERLFPPGTLSMVRGAIKPPPNVASNGIERTNYELASGPVSATESPIMEVRSKVGLYWRGGTFDYYTGHSFKNTAGLGPLSSSETRRRDTEVSSQNYMDPYSNTRGHFELMPDMLDIPESEMNGKQEVAQHFKMLAASTPQIYGAGRIKVLDTDLLSIQTDNVGAITPTVPLQANAEYDVVSVVPSNSADVLKAAPANQVPPDIARLYLQRDTRTSQENPVLAALVAEWTQGAKTNYDKVMAIQNKIAQTCSYNLNTPAIPRDRDVVQYFLTQSKQGYCDSYAAAMTMMCRYAGIPARMAIGFIHGDPSGSETYVVKDKDRHMWTEVFFPHVGWVAFDATEGTTDVTARGAAGQKKPLSFQSWLAKQGLGMKLVELIVLVLLAYLLKTEVIDRIRFRGKSPARVPVTRPATNLAILTAYTSAMRLLARRGLQRAGNLTTVEFETLINARLPEAGIGAALTELTALHDRYYYSSATASQEEVTRAEAALQRLQEALRQYKGDPGKLLQAPQSATT